MSNFKDQDRLERLRERLYERGTRPGGAERHELTDTVVPVPTDWGNRADARHAPEPEPEPAPARDASALESTPEAAAASTGEAGLTADDSFITPMPQKKRNYRIFIVLVSLLTLIVVVGLSSLFLFIGGNNISPRNIDITLSGPFASGGGEVLPLQVGITNQNTTSIEAATLIMKYPAGTRSVDDNPRDLFEERVPLQSIGAGETINVPVRVAVFGEENEEKTITATLEYRLVDSNGTFFKDAEPYTFKVSSAPVSVEIDAVSKISSGQETTITLKLASNAPTPLENVLVTASYPPGFDYTRAEPSPAFGQNSWVIKSLDPEETEEIAITGEILGQRDEEVVLDFTIGKPSQSNQYQMGSVLAKRSVEFLIEQPFIGVSVTVGGDGDGAVVLESGRSASVSVDIVNTLSETVYDVYALAELVGTAVDEEDVRVSGGFYSSSENEVRWDVSSDRDLAQLSPGARKTLNFNFQPQPQESTPTFDIKVSVFGRRVNEPGASEQLIGSSVVNARISTELALSREVGRNSSVFSDSGPVPPVAEKETTYTVTLAVQNGSNDVVDAEVTTSIPQYVSWPNAVSGDGAITFNPVSKTISWAIGPIDANAQKRTSFQVTLLPSLSQIDTTPALLGEQRLRATDRFTGSVIRATAPPASTELPRDGGFGRNSGEVQRPEEADDDDS